MAKFRTAFERRRVTSSTSGKSLTKQSFKKECDVNHILAKYQKTGVLDFARTQQGLYGDVSEKGDFRTACNLVLKAQELFDAMPAKLRKRFSNDPAVFLEFMDDPSNEEEIVRLGLAKLRSSQDSVSTTNHDVSQESNDDKAEGENVEQKEA